MPHLWTAQEAKENARKGGLALAAKRAAQANSSPNPMPEPKRKLGDVMPDDSPKQLVRVRGHIMRIHTLLAAAVEGIEVDRLSRSLNTLLDCARELAGKPKVKPQAAPRVERKEAPKPLD